jgi:hypothetical protein
MELWLDGGNMVINVADWFGYISYEGGWRRTNNLEWGAANILDLPASIIRYADNTLLQATPKGRQYLPSLPDFVVTYRPVVLTSVQAPWEVAAIFASGGGSDDPLIETLADPVVLHNTETGAYAMFVNQAGGGPANWIDRGKVCAEFIANWVMAGREEEPPDGEEEPPQSCNPQPADGAVVDGNVPVGLSWSPGAGAVQYDVYFGSDPNQVDQADTGTAALYRGRQTAATYPLPDALAMGQTCYWRIDDVNEAGQIRKGPIWSFTVASYLLLDGFESYNNACNRVFYTWLDGLGHSGATTCGIAPFGGNRTRSIVSTSVASEEEPTVVHSGAQSLELAYDNSLRPYYSQTERIFSPAQNWARPDVNTLTLYVRGAAGNTVQPLYVEVEDSNQLSKLVNHPDPQAVVNSAWSRWDIALSEFAAGGVDLEHVTRIAIGVGDETVKKAGGRGKVYLDDVRLCNPALSPQEMAPMAAGQP